MGVQHMEVGLGNSVGLHQQVAAHILVGKFVGDLGELRVVGQGRGPLAFVRIDQEGRPVAGREDRLSRAYGDVTVRVAGTEPELLGISRSAPMTCDSVK